MKNKLALSTLRSVKHTFSRFIAIFAIIAIGCGFFAGVKAAGPDLKVSAEEYFSNQSLADIHLISTLGFDDESVAAISAAQETSEYQTGYSAELFVSEGSASGKIVKVYSYSENDKLNLPLLIEGRMPQKADECVIDSKFYSSNQPQIGEAISFTADKDKAIGDILSRTAYTVVGYVQSPMYIAFERGTASIGNGVINGFVFIPQENFSIEVYTDIYVSAAGASELDPFSEKYDRLIADDIEKYEDIGGAELDRRIAEIEKKVSDAKAAFNDAEEKYSDGKADYDSAVNDVNGLKMISDELSEIVTAYSETAGTSEDVTAEIDKLNSYTDKFSVDSTLNSLLNTYITSSGIMATMLKSTAQGGIEQYSAAIDENISTAQDELDNASKTLSDAEKELADGREKLNDAEQDASEVIDGAKLYVFSRDDINPYFSHYSEDCERVDAIAEVFPLFFILVAALVCCTTMTRMVEEQRVQTGTLKALGYSPFSIISQYIIYAVAASVPGAFVGLAVGFRVLPQVIYVCYKSMYNQPFMLTPFRWDYAIGCVVVACLCTGLSAFYAARIELASMPAQLMRPKPPKNGRRILLERINFLWKRMKFTHKVTFRNLFRYKSRLLMTVIGIAGCTALLLTGFGLRDSIVSIVDRQYGDIFTYDALAALDSDSDDEAYSDVIDVVSSDDEVTDYMLALQKITDVYNTEDKSAEVYLVVPSQTNELEKYITLRQRVGHKPLELDSNGIIINEKLSRILSVKVGEKLHFDNGNELTVTGITENYAFNYIYMTPDYYNSSNFTDKLRNNVLFINMTNPELTDNISEKLVGMSDVLAVSFMTGGGDKFRNLVSSLSYIVIAIIVSAGALAFVVLFNLANINVNERVHELATIKVLGFYDSEVAAYVYRENTVLAVIGMLAGLGLGIILEKFVVKTAEVDAVMFSPDIPLSCFVFAAVLTLLFAAAVNVFLFFRLKKIDMAASLKAIE